MAEKKGGKVNVKATALFMQTRFICLPDHLVNKEEFRTLKDGGSIKVDAKNLKENEYYFKKAE